MQLNEKILETSLINLLKLYRFLWKTLSGIIFINKYRLIKIFQVNMYLGTYVIFHSIHLIGFPNSLLYSV